MERGSAGCAWPIEPCMATCATLTSHAHTSTRGKTSAKGKTGTILRVVPRKRLALIAFQVP